MSKIKVIRAKNKLNRAKQMKIWPNLRIQVGKPHPNLMKIGEYGEQAYNPGFEKSCQNDVKNLHIDNLIVDIHQ